MDEDQVLEATDIVELIGRDVELKRRGRNLVGMCPFHEDSSPVMHVNRERQTWKCWTCNIGGDCIDFVMQSQGVAREEAVRILEDISQGEE